MNAHEYILSKQIQWAYRNNIVEDICSTKE